MSVTTRLLLFALTLVANVCTVVVADDPLMTPRECVDVVDVGTWDKKRGIPVWQWSPEAEKCGFRQPLDDNMHNVVASKKWIAFVGDSQVRNVYRSVVAALGLADLLAESDGDDNLRHADQSIHKEEISLTISFHWRPFVKDVNDFFADQRIDRRGNNVVPNAIVFNSGLWDMLHVRDEALFIENLQAINEHIDHCHDIMIQMFSLADVVEERLTDEDKKQFLTRKQVQVYNRFLSREISISKHVVFIDTYAVTQIGLSDTPDIDLFSPDGVHMKTPVFDVLGLMSIESLGVLWQSEKTLHPPQSLQNIILGLFVFCCTVSMIFLEDNFFVLGWIGSIFPQYHTTWEEVFPPLHQQLGIFSSQEKPDLETATAPTPESVGHEKSAN